MLPFLTRLDCYFYSEVLLYIIDSAAWGRIALVYFLYMMHSNNNYNNNIYIYIYICKLIYIYTL